MKVVCVITAGISSVKKAGNENEPADSMMKKSIRLDGYTSYPAVRDFFIGEYGRKCSGVVLYFRRGYRRGP